MIAAVFQVTMKTIFKYILIRYHLIVNFIPAAASQHVMHRITLEDDAQSAAYLFFLLSR